MATRMCRYQRFLFGEEAAQPRLSSRVAVAGGMLTELCGSGISSQAKSSPGRGRPTGSARRLQLA